MPDVTNFPFARVIYEVERSIEVAAVFRGGEEYFRIDALKGPDGYVSNTYILSDELIQAAYPPTTRTAPPGPREVRVWLAFNETPWTAGPTAEAVLSQALGFLQERSGVTA